jgi:hypothetical protein
MQTSNNNYIVGKSYTIESNIGGGKWIGTYVGNNIHNQPTFKISDICEVQKNNKCLFFNNNTIKTEIVNNEPLYTNCCLCQFVSKQNDKWIII